MIYHLVFTIHCLQYGCSVVATVSRVRFSHNIHVIWLTSGGGGGGAQVGLVWGQHSDG